MAMLEWMGKNKIINHHNEVKYRTLNRIYSFDEESGEHQEDNGSENMIIHGDNLVALKSLLPKYEGKIKCIYIDPPYNTAKSSNKNKTWVYSDNVDDPRIQKWLGEAIGDENLDLSRHDKWLCMMYPRLKLLEKLLCESGIIFISIDDNESHSLRMICDEIFGRQSFVSQFVWRSDGNFDNQAKIKNVHEYILCYIKKPEMLGVPNGIDPSVSEGSKIYNDEIRNTVVKNGPKNPMSTILLKKGFPCAIEKGVIKARSDAFPMYEEDLKIEDWHLVNEVEATSGWASKAQLVSFIDNGFNPVEDTKGQETVFELSKTGAIELVKKRGKTSHVLSILQNLGSTQAMSTELGKMGISFDFPKPIELIEYLIDFYCDKDDIILDSFAGSGTTAHAVLDMNKKDSGNRKFIIIEMMDYAEELTAERVKNVITGYGKGKNQVEGTGGSFSYYELGNYIFDKSGRISESISVDELRRYVFYSETKGKEPKAVEDNEYYMGTHEKTDYYLYYDKEKSTTLNYDFLSTITKKQEAYVIYADRCLLSEDALIKNSITFKKIPRDIIKI